MDNKDYAVIKDYSEFSGMTISEIEHRISNFKELTRNEWNDFPYKTFHEKTFNFYKESKNYIFDLLSAGYEKEALINKLNYFNPFILLSLKIHPGKKFIDFGGGLGLMCEIACELGKEATYLDIPGQVFEFAKWRFRKYNIPIKMICSSPVNPLLSDNFDIIFSDAVFEHLVDPEGTAEILCAHINPGGLFILLVDLSGYTTEMPMHRNIDIQKIHQIIENKGLVNIQGKNTFCSIWKNE